MKTAVKEPISIVQATQMTKTDLVNFLFEEVAEAIQEEIPEKLWASTEIGANNKGKYHPPTHVLDTRDNEIINLIDYGRRICLIN